MSKIQTFIVGHTQDYIAKYIDEYRKFENLSVLFVGSGLCDKIRNLPEVVICRELPRNIEDKKELLHYTAIYAILNNKLIHSDTEYIRLYEWDIAWEDDYIPKSRAFIKTHKPHIVCCQTLRYSNYFIKPFYLFSLLHFGYQQVYGKGTEALMKKVPFKNQEWMVSINFIMSVDYLKNFNKFIKPIIPHFEGREQAGNNLERAFTIHCLHEGIEFHKFPGVINLFANSHRTSKSKVKSIDEINPQDYKIPSF
jgi:hypothetical protein